MAPSLSSQASGFDWGHAGAPPIPGDFRDLMVVEPSMGIYVMGFNGI